MVTKTIHFLSSLVKIARVLLDNIFSHGGIVYCPSAPENVTLSDINVISGLVVRVNVALGYTL